MYNEMTVHVAFERLESLLRERSEFKTAKGNPFSARIVGADLELKAAAGTRRVNFGEFTMFMRAAHRMHAPDLDEFRRFTAVAPALLALVDAVAARATKPASTAARPTATPPAPMRGVFPPSRGAPWVPPSRSSRMQDGAQSER